MLCRLILVNVSTSPIISNMCMKKLICLLCIFSIFASLAYKKGTASTIYVKTAAELKKAIKNAKPGDIIEMADGEYLGKFKIEEGINGLPGNPIVLRGSEKAILTTGDTSSGYGLHAAGNNYWHFKGFTISDCKKAFILDKSNYNVIDGLTIRKTSEEGIHFRVHSSYNVVKNCKVYDIGLLKPAYGEGCYIGSAVSNWGRYTEGKSDTCNYNIVENNIFGPGVAAEAIDIKEGTSYNIVRGNTFYGKGQQGVNSGDSWMEVKGNYNLIENNTGHDALKDGFQVTIKAEGWGAHNIFKNNTCNVNGAGYGIHIQLLNGTANGNKVYRNNKITNAASGLTNIETTQ
jgi:hypothetical protein